MSEQEFGSPDEELRTIEEQIESATEFEGLRPVFYRLDKLLKTFPGDAGVQQAGIKLKERLVARGTLLKQNAGVPPAAPAAAPAEIPASAPVFQPAPAPPVSAYVPPAPPVQIPAAPQASAAAMAPAVRRSFPGLALIAIVITAALLVLGAIYVGVSMYTSRLRPVPTDAQPVASSSAPTPPATAPVPTGSAPAPVPTGSAPAPVPSASAPPPVQQAAPDVSASAPATAEQRVKVQRYPSLEAPDAVVPAQPFSLQASLSMEPLSTGVQVVAGPESSVDGSGRLSMSLPYRGGRPWTIGVVLNAPDFEIAGGRNQADIQLPDSGDSTPALFQLKAKASGSQRATGRISATFWLEGTYLARATRTIAIVANDRPGAVTAAHGPVGAGREMVANAVIGTAEAAPDLTLYIQESRAGDRTVCQLTVESPYLQPASASCMPGDAIRPWLAQQYDAVLHAAESFRGVRTPGGGQPAGKEQVLAMLRGLGEELYRRVGGPLFDDAFWKLVDREQAGGFHFRSIQIYTNNPVIPWELMVPVHGGRARDACLGAEFNMARWHITEEVSTHDKPPALLPLQRVEAIVPDYAGGMKLVHQAEEISALEKLSGFSRVPAQLSSVAALLRNPPDGIVHFAGHGVAASSGGAVANSAIELEGDTSLDSMSWRGMARGGQHHPLYFFNACDVGQTRRVLNFVDGWAPAVLDGGASGFLGGLWPLGDKGAAEFAVQFYRGLSEQLSGTGAASVAELLAQSRKQFYSTADPTFLGYVFYGDVGLRLVRP